MFLECRRCNFHIQDHPRCRWFHCKTPHFLCILDHGFGDVCGISVWSWVMVMVFGGRIQVGPGVPPAEGGPTPRGLLLLLLLLLTRSPFPFLCMVFAFLFAFQIWDFRFRVFDFGFRHCPDTAWIVSNPADLVRRIKISSVWIRNESWLKVSGPQL